MSKTVLILASALLLAVVSAQPYRDGPYGSIFNLKGNWKRTACECTPQQGFKTSEEFCDYEFDSLYSINQNYQNLLYVPWNPTGCDGECYWAVSSIDKTGTGAFMDGEIQCETSFDPAAKTITLSNCTQEESFLCENVVFSFVGAYAPPASITPIDAGLEGAAPDAKYHKGSCWNKCGVVNDLGGGENSTDDECWCDGECTFYGDCCEDATTFCPDEFNGKHHAAPEAEEEEDNSTIAATGHAGNSTTAFLELSDDEDSEMAAAEGDDASDSAMSADGDASEDVSDQSAESGDDSSSSDTDGATDVASFLQLRKRV
eukprot:GILJ01000095.1.p1 GENE.GILJ01000095.1~~GILJ01000095.1.p1  ORF type:complete len:338 (+),score=79.76 GILJ01000095.1:67-1014(+)